MKTGLEIGADTLAMASADAVACDLEGEVVILNVETAVYFGLNPVGSEIWKLIQQSRSVEEIVADLVARYPVDRARCESEVVSLLQELAKHGLVRIEPA